jgi:hypothetical protein
MRADLLHAQASVHWAVAQFESLENRINTWLHLNVSGRVKETDSPATHNFIVMVEKEPLPLAFHVEIGAYINAIRSSLDLLATALAERYGVPKPEDAYFPIANSAAVFAKGNYKGRKLVKGLPAPERKIIEDLKPYKGGHKLLWPLHQLDIMRKHRRLIRVEPSPVFFRIYGEGVQPVATGWLRTQDETVLGLIGKDAPKPQITQSFSITIGESVLPDGKPVVAALDDFAFVAESIIKRFDN